MDQRVSKLETDMEVQKVRMDSLESHYKEEIKELKDVVQTLKEGFDSMRELVTQIKWWVIGAVSILAFKELGIVGVIMSLLK